jgi:Starch binding domain
VVAKSSALNVSTVKTFAFNLTPVAATTSVNFVCDRGFTNPGESIYIVGNLPILGEWNPTKAIKLDPNVYYQYIIDGRSNPGPAAPIWTKVVTGLPPNTALEWKCLKRREDGSGALTWQPGENNRQTTGQTGYAGRSYGTF